MCLYLCKSTQLSSSVKKDKAMLSIDLLRASGLKEATHTCGMVRQAHTLTLLQAPKGGVALQDTKMEYSEIVGAGKASVFYGQGRLLRLRGALGPCDYGSLAHKDCRNSVTPQK